MGWTVGALLVICAVWLIIRKPTYFKTTSGMVLIGLGTLVLLTEFEVSPLIKTALTIVLVIASGLASAKLQKNKLGLGLLISLAALVIMLVFALVLLTHFSDILNTIILPLDEFGSTLTSGS